MTAVSHTGEYTEKETWIGSFDGLHETLLAQGVASSGRRWAFVKQWTARPRYKSEECEKYIMRLDMSEWWNTYSRSYCELYGKKLLPCSDLKSTGSKFTGCLSNMSPGWWDNGFSVQMCFEAIVVQYASAEDRLRTVVSGGLDFDSFDPQLVADEICEKLQPTINFFKSVGKPANPNGDW